MSMACHVLVPGPLPSKAALQRRLRDLSLPFTLRPATGSIETQAGFMPMGYRRCATGAELDLSHGEDIEAMAGWADPEDADRIRTFERMVNLRWGGDLLEAAAAWACAAALTSLTGGVAVEPEEMRLLDEAGAVEEAQGLLRSATATLSRSRAPSAKALIRRALKPLLAMRDDVVLTGHVLVVGPVRHILRGALLNARASEGQVGAQRFIHPLYDTPYTEWPSTIGGQVDQPDFQAAFFDMLRNDTLHHADAVRSIEDFLVLARRWWRSHVYHSVLLGRGIAEARAYLDAQREPGRPELDWVTSERAKLDAPPAEVFASYHAKVERAVQAYGINSLWRPTPFPAELAPNQRRRSPVEGPLPMDPWPTYGHSWRGDLPREAGEVGYGLDWWARRGEVFVITPLSRAEAAARHERLDTYVFGTQTRSGVTLMVRRWQIPFRRPTGEGIGEFEEVPDRPQWYVWAQGADGAVLRAQFRCNDREPELTRLESVDIEQGWDSSFHWLGPWERKLNHHLTIEGETRLRRWPMTSAEWENLRLPMPGVGEWQPLWDCVQAYLEREDGGPFT